MSGSRIWIAAGVLALLSVVPAPAGAVETETTDATVYSPTFADVPDDHVFATSIRALFASGVTVGCNQSGTEFCPERTLTRAEMAGFLDRALDLPPATNADFADDDGHTFEDAIERLATAGITRGCNPPANNHFCPDRAITRAEMAGFLDRALDLPPATNADFADDDGHTFEDAIERLATAGITRGCNPPANNHFCPDRAITRAEMATFLTRGLHLAVPRAVPNGVLLERSPSTGTGFGTALTVCRDTAISLVVRSVAGGVPGAPDVTGHAPTSETISEGELDVTADRWILPAGEGCSSIDASWDPTANELTPPLSMLVVASPFGNRFHPILGYTRLHAGTDFEAEYGDSVSAAASGIVSEAGPVGDYGNLVEIKHPGGLATRYAHLSAVLVSVGDVVPAGTVVGSVGCTGLCTAPHLHFETREFGEPVDPMSYLG